VPSAATVVGAVAVRHDAGSVDGAAPSDDPSQALFKAHPDESAPWTNGATSQLRVQTTEMAMHDGTYGAARLELRALAGGKPIATKRLEGTWKVLCYVAARRAFLIGGQFEIGAWLPLDDLQFVDEGTGALTRSRVTADGGWIAFAAVPGPEGRFVAAVGIFRRDQSFSAGRFRLQLYDAVQDALYDVGRPPAPAPDPDAVYDDDGGWDWGDPIDGLTEMDPGTIVFSDPHTLQVSYGADTRKRRARQRQTKSWDLARVSAGRSLAAPRPGSLSKSSGSPVLEMKNPF